MVGDGGVEEVVDFWRGHGGQQEGRDLYCCFVMLWRKETWMVEQLEVGGA